jgi:hypothetical protein
MLELPEGVRIVDLDFGDHTTEASPLGEICMILSRKIEYSVDGIKSNNKSFESNW